MATRTKTTPVTPAKPATPAKSTKSATPKPRNAPLSPKSSSKLATTIRAGSAVKAATKLLPRTQVARPKPTGQGSKPTGRAANARGNRKATTIRSTASNSGG